MDNCVVFLESCVVVCFKGVIVEWRKLEGILINQKCVKEVVEGVDIIEGEVVQNVYFYIGIVDIDNIMIDGEGDMQFLVCVKDCGGVYCVKFEEGYNIFCIEFVVMGGMYCLSLIGVECCDVEQFF